MMEEFSVKNSRNEKLVGVIDFPENGEQKFPVAVYVHRLYSSKNSGKALESLPLILNKGIAFLRFDLSGAGKSEGKFEETTVSKQIEDLKAVITFIKTHKKLDAKRIALIGSSLGGFESLIFAAKEKIKAVILLAPVSRFSKEIFEKVVEMPIKKWKEKGFAFAFPSEYKNLKINYSFYEDGSKYKINNLVKKIFSPILIIHGTKDEIVPTQDSLKLFQCLESEKELKLIENADHDLIVNGSFEEAKTSIIDFLTKKLFKSD